MRAATYVYLYGACADFDICDSRDEIEQEVLSIHYLCGADIYFQVQSMTSAQLEFACNSLVGMGTIFHVQLDTNREPVAGDLNSTLEVIVFSDWKEYDLYSPLFFGNSTDNGGIYLEGDPSNPSNQARFIAHLADWLPDSPVWNLEHEYVHYLDGRFNLAGDFDDLRIDTHKTMWWLEGLAEYITHWDDRAAIRRYAKGGVPPLWDVFGVTYDGSSDEVYRDTHLAMWFMVDQHREDVRRFRGFFRAGDYHGYRDYLNNVIGERYEHEWRRWIVQSGNRAPEVVNPLPHRVMTLHSSLVLNVALAFGDPNGEALTYAVSSSAPRTVEAQVSGSRVTLSARALGSAVVEVSATDAGGSSATQSFTVTVRPFTDHPIVPGETPVRAVHFTELRTRIDALRSAAGEGPFAWTDPVLQPGVTRFRLVHLLELRSALAAAYAASGRPAPPWTDASPVGGTTPIRAAHLMELRAAVVALE